ncbi:MAG: DUF1631 family protein [Gammaproteobacteria bacterium]
MEDKKITLAQAQKVFADYFEQLVDDCCHRIDVEFDMQYRKVKGQISSVSYKELLAYLRTQKKPMKRHFLSAVHAAFGDFQRYREDGTVVGRKLGIDMETVAIAADEQVEKDYALAKMVRVNKERFHEELQVLDKCFAALCGRHSIPSPLIPVSPESLVGALVNALDFLKISSDQKVSLYRAFDSNVLQQVGFIYRELIQLFGSGKIVAEALPSDDRGERETDGVDVVAAEKIGLPEDFVRLQDGLSNWRKRAAPPGCRLTTDAARESSYEHYEVINALGLVSDTAFALIKKGNEDKKSLKQAVFETLRSIDAGGGGRVLAMEDEDALDLVQLIFQSIADEDISPASVRDALAGLMIPYAKLAISDKAFFVDTEHPARRLLHHMSRAGQFLNSDEYADKLVCNQIERLAKEIADCEQIKLSRFLSWSKDFADFMEKQDKKNEVMTERTKQLIRNKENLDIGKTKVREEISKSMKGRQIPDKIAAFIRDVWSDILLLGYVRRLEEPQVWESSLKTMDDLIASVMPPEGDEERKKLLKMLPGLVQDLKSGLNRISYDKHSQSRFFKDLAVHHVILMNKVSSALKKTEGKPPSAEEIERIEEAAEGDVPGDEFWRQAHSVESDQWFRFITEPGPKWGRLIWKSEETGRMLFAGRTGAKIEVMTAAELADGLREQEIVVVQNSDSEPVEKALSRLSPE